MRAFIHHFFLPHHSNNHRPRLLHIDALFTYVVGLTLFLFGLQAVHRTFPDVLGYATDIYVEKLLAETNSRRKDVGLEPLSLNAKLSTAAVHKAQDMFAKNYWAHNSPDGRKPWDFINETGYSYSLAGENLAKNFVDSTSVVDGWMASTSHRDNVLKPGYRDIGFAVVSGILDGEETTLIVQFFGTEADTQEIAAVPAPRDVTLEGTTRDTETSVSGFMSSRKKPMFDIPAISYTGVYLLIGALSGVLVTDGVMSARRKTVRVTGHNIAHLMFFAALLILVGGALRGSIL
ncbi:MAG: CAP domain-containing protein [bacterium]|nr:CAP domain-containing protein [bacterium]